MVEGAAEVREAQQLIRGDGEDDDDEMAAVVEIVLASDAVVGDDDVAGVVSGLPAGPG